MQIIKLWNDDIYYHSYLAFSSGTESLDRLLNIDEGIRSLKMTPKKRGSEPRPRQMRCSWRVSGTVLRDSPPNWMQAIWIAIVRTRMMKKSGLLKKFLKMLISEDFSLRELI